MKKILYIMDPQCGWCYGNSKNILGLKNKFQDQVGFEILVGGMMLGNQAPFGGDAFHQFIQSHSPRMEEYTGAYVSPAFYELTKDKSYQFQSLDACMAIVAVKHIDESKAFEFASAVQTAQFADAKRFDSDSTYYEILEKLDIKKEEFILSWKSELNLKRTHEEFAVASKLVQGFPALILLDGQEGKLLASGYFKLEEMSQLVEKLLKE